MRSKGEPVDVTPGWRSAAVSVLEVDPHFGGRQCFRKTGHGPAFLYCRQHAAALAPQQPEIVSGSKEHLDHLSALFGL